MLYEGNAAEVLSRVASYASVRFNYHLQRYFLPDSTYTPDAHHEIRRYNKIFDCRLVVCDEPLSVMRHMFWRSVGDCQRNAVSSFARKVFPRMKFTKLKQFSMIGRLESCGLSWVSHVPAYCKYGVWSKRHTAQRSEYVQEYGREIIKENERVVNFTCNLRFVPEWEWMIQD